MFIVIMISKLSSFNFNFSNFFVIICFLTKLLILGALFSIAVNAVNLFAKRYTTNWSEEVLVLYYARAEAKPSPKDIYQILRYFDVFLDLMLMLLQLILMELKHL